MSNICRRDLRARDQYQMSTTSVSPVLDARDHNAFPICYPCCFPHSVERTEITDNQELHVRCLSQSGIACSLSLTFRPKTSKFSLLLGYLYVLVYNQCTLATPDTSSSHQFLATSHSPHLNYLSALLAAFNIWCCYLYILTSQNSMSDVVYITPTGLTFQLFMVLMLSLVDLEGNVSFSFNPSARLLYDHLIGSEAYLPLTLSCLLVDKVKKKGGGEEEEVFIYFIEDKLCGDVGNFKLIYALFKYNHVI